MKTGPYLKKLRLKKNIRANYVAKQIGVSKEYLSRIEKGERMPSDSVLSSYIDVLDHNFSPKIERLVRDDLFVMWGAR